MNGYLRLMILFAILWTGYVLAISFMEAPLKFTAPNITLALGVGIGKIVFHTLNKIEWVFVLAITVIYFLKAEIYPKYTFFIVLLLLILLIQTFGLYPILDKRAEIVINGGEPEPSYIHIVYIVTDAIKVLVLFVFSWQLFDLKMKNN